MSFRGGRRGRFGRPGGGRGGFRSFREDAGPPDTVTELGHFTHVCLEQIVCKCTTEKLPHFNAPVFFENKTQVGKVDEIFGGIRNHFISVTLMQGFKASSFAVGDKVFIDPYKLLPLERFLPDAPQSRGAGRGGRGRRGFDRGGRGGFDRGGRRGFDRGGRRGFDRGGHRGFDRGGRGRGFDRGSWGRGSNDRGRDAGFGDYKRHSDDSTPNSKKFKFE